MTNSRVTCGPCNRGEHDKCYGSPPATAVMCDCRDAGHQRSSKEKMQHQLTSLLYALHVQLDVNQHIPESVKTDRGRFYIRQWLTQIRTGLTEFEEAFRASNEPPAVPTWTCINCGAVDEFSVKSEVVDEAGHVLPVVECHVCDLKCSHAVEANTPRIDLKPTPPPSEYPEELFDGYAVERELTGQARRRTSTENVIDVLDAVVRLMKKRRARPTKGAAP